jgi:hypothetical protein
LNAIESLNFDIKAEGVHLLPNFLNEKKNITSKSLLCLGAINTGAVHFQVSCHDVETTINIKFNRLNLVIFENEAIIYGLTTGQMLKFDIFDNKYTIENTKEKEFLLILKFKPLPLLKSLANPIIDIKFDVAIPLDRGVVKKTLKKKLRCFNSKTLKLTLE